MSPSRRPSRGLGLVSSRKTSWKSKPGFMCRSQKPAVRSRVVDAKACFSFWFFSLFCLERSALQNLARRRQLFERKKRCTLGLELVIVLSELWFVLLVQCRTQRTPPFFWSLLRLNIFGVLPCAAVHCDK